MNSSAKFQLHPLLASEMIYDLCVCKFRLLIAMTSNQIQKTGQKWYVLVQAAL